MLRRTALLAACLVCLLSLMGCGVPEPADDSATVQEDVKASVLGEDFSVDVTSTVAAEGATLPLVGDTFAAKTRAYGVTLTWSQADKTVVLGPLPPYEGADSAAALAEGWAALDEAFRGFVLDKVAQNLKDGERLTGLRVAPMGLDDPEQPGQGTRFDADYIAPEGTVRTESWEWRVPAGWMPPA